VDSVITSDSEFLEREFEELSGDKVEILSTDFEDCVFRRCAFPGAIFRACEFTSCTFLQCDLALVRLTNSSFSGCRFEDSKLIGVNWAEARWAASKLWRPVHFVRCVLDHSTFLGLDLTDVSFEECVAHDVDFREANLTRALFRGTDLDRSLFAGTDLTEADLSGARNYRIHPAENKIKKAKFSMPEAMSLLEGLDIDLTGWEP